MQNNWINGKLTAPPEEFVLGQTRFLYFTIETLDGEELEIITAGKPVIYLKELSVGNYINISIQESYLKQFKFFATCIILN